MIELISAHSPVWADKEKTKINIMCQFAHLKDEVEFTAEITDTENHGRDIFIHCMAGKYGEIKEFE